MSQTLWIIDNFRKDQCALELAEAVKSSGRICEILGGKDSFSPFEVLAKYDVSTDIIATGSIQFIDLLIRDSGRHIWAWNTKENYLCSNYYEKFSSLLFNDAYSLIPASEILRNKWLYFDKYSKEAVIFIRPDDGDKSFKGGLFDLQYFDKDFAKIMESYPKNGLVVISTPKNIKGGFRFVCIEDRIVASSTYIYGGQITQIPSVPPEALKKCEEVLAVGFYPDLVFTVDICQDGDGNFWLLELNSFSSAGLYACDKNKIVKEVSELVEGIHGKID